jgi:hypothetical protein
MQNVFFADAQELRVAAYSGANCVLIAMSLADNATENLAGFAIYRQPKGEPEQALLNRLSFDDTVTKATTPAQRRWTPTNIAPIQKFRWVDVPPNGIEKEIAYRVVAMYFTGVGVALREGAQARVVVDPKLDLHEKFNAAFTRGYISSQAYADRFHNAPIRPDGPKSPDFDTAPYRAQYEWLGAGARKALFDFLDRCRRDKTAKIDVFAYDLDEPDIIAAICEFGREGRLRAVLDNAPLHLGDAPEVDAAKLIIEAAGADNVVQGHFGRYQHNKVFIERDSSGVARRVLFGSMNFSVRGLYVQSNNVIVAEDDRTPAYFAEAFDNAFENGVSAPKFKKDPIASDYHPISTASNADLPKAKIALSPHDDSDISLGPVTQRIRSATSSVLFAVMEPTGGGDLLEALRSIAAEPTVFSYGTVETAKGLAVQRGDGAMGDVADFAYLKSKVPFPFSKEFDPGPGRHIHDKFLVIDFNGDNPTIVTGSSNLAAGGEKANGDSLVFIEDRGLATVYAIEALKIFDHYSFRDKMREATAAEPLALWRPDRAGQRAPWWTSYYDEKNIKYRDRRLFAVSPPPAGLRSIKNPDWSSIAPPAPKSASQSATKLEPAAPNAPAAAAAPPKASAPAAPASATPKRRKTAAKKAKKTTAKPAARKKPAKKTARRAAAKPARKAAAKKSARKTAAKKSRKSAPRKLTTRRATSAKKVARKLTRKATKTPARKAVKKTLKKTAKKPVKKTRTAPRKATKKSYRRR